MLAGLGWLAFVGGYAYGSNADVPSYSLPKKGHAAVPYIMAATVSPLLIIFLIVEAALLIKNPYSTTAHAILSALIAFFFMITIPCISIFVHPEALYIESAIENESTVQGHIGAVFAGGVMQLLFLGLAFICFTLATVCRKAEK